MTVLRGRLRPAAPAAALAAAVIALVLAALTVPLAGLARQGLLGGSSVVLVPGFLIVGFVLARQRPGNPLGWIMLSAAVFLVLSDDSSLYAVADYRLRHGDLPLGWVAMLAQPSWAPAIVCFGLAILLFPDGRLPSHRWRWALWAYLALGALWFAGALGITVTAIARHDIRVDSGGNLTPLGQPTGGAGWWGLIQNVFFLALGVFGLAALGAQAASWRRASGERREQLKWLMGGAALALAGGALTASLSGSASPLWRTVGNVATVAIVALPLGMGVAILRYRLYDIDRIISRTLAYAIVTGLLVGVYAGLVLLATQVLPLSGTVGVAAATLAAAALFSPLRRQVQRIVDRRFNRARYDADRTVAAFAVRLQDATDLGTVRADLLAVVRRSLEPAHAAVWLKGAGR
jgi:hypothetical protein